MQNEIINKYISSFALLERILNGQKDQPVHDVRRAALKSFSNLGFPGRKDERWKYTDVSPFSKQKLEAFIDPKMLSEKDTATFNLYDKIVANKLVFINGHFHADLSKILDDAKGLTIGSLKQHMLESAGLINEHFGKAVNVEIESFSALNTAFMQDGAYIHVPKNTILKYPVMIIFLTGGEEQVISNPRNLIIAEENSQLQIIEDSQSANAQVSSHVNLLSEIVLKQNARVDHTIIQDHGDRYHQISTYKITQHRDSHYRSATISLGGKLVRNNMEVFFDEDHCECDLQGVYIAEDNDFVDNHILVEHRKPHCLSNQLYKGILDDNGKAVFNGKVFVAEDAQKTNAYQSNKNILLSSKATINTKPELEIFADDVKCSHGATSGQLDEDALFYLKARGLPEDKAKSLMIYAFVNEVVEGISNEALKVDIDDRIRKKLNLDQI